MYFRGWLHSWTCGDCFSAYSYWRLRAFWDGVKHERGADNPPKRCPSSFLWEAMWMAGYNSADDTLEF
jgi:hypothetical protein|nr:MAG TPA: hypothetical protein [Caudoviricetes sp.]